MPNLSQRGESQIVQSCFGVCSNLRSTDSLFCHAMRLTHGDGKRKQNPTSEILVPNKFTVLWPDEEE